MNKMLCCVPSFKGCRYLGSEQTRGWIFEVACLEKLFPEVKILGNHPSENSRRTSDDDLYGEWITASISVNLLSCFWNLSFFFLFPLKRIKWPSSKFKKKEKKSIFRWITQNQTHIWTQTTDFLKPKENKKLKKWRKRKKCRKVRKWVILQKPVPNSLPHSPHSHLTLYLGTQH